MTTSQIGRMRIEQREGLRTSAYLDSGGVPTIGYGHTAGVHMGMTCSAAQADAWLIEDLRTAEQAINSKVRTALNQNQFDALVSLVFNIGIGNFSNSTLLKLLNVPNYDAASNQFLVWDKVGGQVNQGLFNRRSIERVQFCEPVSA